MDINGVARSRPPQLPLRRPRHDAADDRVAGQLVEQEWVLAEPVRDEPVAEDVEQRVAVEEVRRDVDRDAVDNRCGSGEESPVRQGASLVLTRSLVVLVVLLAAAPGAADAAVVAHPPSGPVSGVTVGAMDAWRGIPYARPAVGSLRFRGPQPMPKWTAVRSATTFGSACLQGFDQELYGSEDCLYLNVFAPADLRRNSRLPVMVHVHGGSNFFGQAEQDPSNLVPRGVIVVTFNYRLGVLGWLGHRTLTAEAGTPSGEYALLDQLQALRWVHDNIAAFGGDPANVTLFGFSAGSFDAAALAASPPTRGLIARAAIQGIHFQAMDSLPISVAERMGDEVASAVGCDRAADVPSCLRGAPVASLIAGYGGDTYVAPRFGGQVLARPLAEQVAASRSQVPLLIGFGREEDLAFEDPLIGVDEIGPDAFDRFVEDLVDKKYAPRIERLYPYADYGSYKWAFVTMETDAARGCPSRRYANAVRAPVYRYLFTHAYANDPGLAALRTIHGFGENAFLWDYLPDDAYLPTDGERRLTDQLGAYWTNFAKTGDPNGPGLPAWPRYTQPAEPILQFEDPIGTISRYHVDQCAFIDKLPGLFPDPPPHEDPLNGP